MLETAPAGRGLILRPMTNLKAGGILCGLLLPCQLRVFQSPPPQICVNRRKPAVSKSPPNFAPLPLDSPRGPEALEGREASFFQIARSVSL